jgi:hypothetical protein
MSSSTRFAVGFFAAGCVCEAAAEVANHFGASELTVLAFALGGVGLMVFGLYTCGIELGPVQEGGCREGNEVGAGDDPQGAYQGLPSSV